MSAATRLPVSTAREAARLTGALVLRRRGVLTACVTAFVVQGLAGLVAPWMLGRIVDVVRDGGPRDDLVAAVAWILGAAVVGGLSTVLATVLLARVAEPALADLREQVVDRALHLDSAELEAAGSGDLLSRVGDDVRLVASSFSDVVPFLVNAVLAVVLTAGGLFALDWRLGLAGLVAGPFYVASLRWYLPRSGPYYRREREANGDRAEALLTGVHGSRTLRAFGLAAGHQEQVAAASWRSASLTIDVFHLLTRFFGRNNRAELVGLLAILLVGFALVRADAASVGAATAAALFFHRLFNPIGGLVTLFDEAQSAGASLTRLAGLALLPPPVRPAPTGVPAGAGLAVRGLHHEYVPGRPAIDEVDIEVPRGHRVAVVGASGAGKSTLGLAVAGRLVPTRGDVRLGGVPLATADTGDRPAVALVTQEVHVFSGTLRDNLTLAAPGADDARLEAALRTVGAWPAVAALPERLGTRVGDGATPLAPALAQQLALARVVLADPWVVVLDEATAEAGSTGARDLEQAATAATQGRTTLTIAHRLTQAQHADAVVVMEAGRVVEAGPHHELVAARGRYARLWAAWADAPEIPD
ncbi:ABC transporter ATP-binding protein [Nocardioides sp. SYSU D00038]|uniref:ABC transporter ATP-binding protein n=1 Tax=Nocardioides sp. SYSU D00038 TaxID=2812554 RepID=UPI001968740C|nr:ABC transporter ATP-binding protein [Nocardioides sp. SYSU D00038]